MPHTSFDVATDRVLIDRRILCVQSLEQKVSSRKSWSAMRALLYLSAWLTQLVPIRVENIW